MATATQAAPAMAPASGGEAGEKPAAAEKAKDPKANLPGGVNPLDFLYKLATQRALQPPEFKQVTEQGPAHMKTFVWHCSFNQLVAQGSGRSKKEAKIAAAKAIRDNLDYAALPPPTAPSFSSGNREGGGGRGQKRKGQGGQDGFGTKKIRGRGGGPPMGMGFGFGPGPMGPGPMGPPMMGPGPMGPPMGFYNGPGPGFGGFGGMGPFGGPGGMGMGGGPGPIDPKGQDPFGNGTDGEKGGDEEGTEGKDGEGGKDGENGEKSESSRSNEYMTPSFGGFFRDDDDVSAFEGEDGMKRSMMMADYQSRQHRGYRSRLSKLDRHVIRKHKEIYPKESDLASILRLVTRTEESLKLVADALNTKELKKITGMVRVGDLSKGLLLAGQKVVDLVLLIKAPPTIQILNEVETTLKQKFQEKAEKKAKKVEVKKEDEKSAEIKTEKGEEAAEEPAAEGGEGGEVEPAVTVTSLDSGLVVSCGEYTVRVTLASTKKDEDAPAFEDDKSQLLTNTEAVTRALTELRHSKWFAVTAANLPSCVECIRVVKDLCIRDPAWSVLSGWAVEILVERALYTAWVPLNPAASLMRVMEVVSSGLLLEDGCGLKDPCEKEDVDVTANLTNQEKEDITRSAQEYLRRMHFRQLFKVLGISEAEADEVEGNGGGDTAANESTDQADKENNGK